MTYITLSSLLGVSLGLLPTVVQPAAGEHSIHEVRHLTALAERVVVSIELVAEVSISLQVDFLIGGEVPADEPQVVRPQAPDGHEHEKGVQQEEREHPGQRGAVPVA